MECPKNTFEETYDVVVVGAGHAGCERKEILCSGCLYRVREMYRSLPLK